MKTLRRGNENDKAFFGGRFFLGSLGLVRWGFWFIWFGSVRLVRCFLGSLGFCRSEFFIRASSRFAFARKHFMFQPLFAKGRSLFRLKNSGLGRLGADVFQNRWVGGNLARCGWEGFPVCCVQRSFLSVRLGWQFGSVRLGGFSRWEGFTGFFVLFGVTEGW